MDIKYKKINLRDFRHNLTQLKDSLNAGQAYEVIDRGKTLAFFIPSDYEIIISRKEEKKQKEFEKKMKDLFGCVKMSKEEKENFDYKKVYRKMLEDEYLK